MTDYNLDDIVEQMRHNSRIANIEGEEGGAVAFHSRDSDFPFTLMKAINESDIVEIYNIQASYDPDIGHATARIILYENHKQ